jgi:Xaa-Pro aminopeptidase
LVQSGDDTILSDPRFTLQIEEECPGLAAVIKTRETPISKTLAKLLGKTTGELGIEDESVTLAQLDRLFEFLPRWQPVPTKSVVEELRQIKDKDELAHIRQAVDIAAKAFYDVRSRLRPSMSEIDICIVLEHQMRLLGAEEKSFPSIIGAGERAALPHANPSKKTLSREQLLLFDWGSVVNGYMSDLTRVLILLPSKRLQTVYETVLKAQEAAIAAIKPGKICEDIDTIARNVIKDAGFGKYFDHGLGHSIGLQVHENPRFRKGDKTVLKAGMVLTVEPGIYMRAWGGVRIEDDVLVTKSGCEVLSRAVPKSYDEMIVRL